MNKRRHIKPRMPNYLVAIVSASGVVKHVEPFFNYNHAETYIINHDNKHRVLLSYKQNCMASDITQRSSEKPPKVFPKPGFFAVLKPGTRFTVFHQDERLALSEGARIAETERTMVGLFEVTRVYSKQQPKTERAERAERRRVRV
ncbi:MAG: hypothetical protein KC422_01845 [Trueperaceae bacterium]|nr:hypothetical protein [Trueperaceae bacterium]